MQNTKEPHRIHNPSSACACHIQHSSKVIEDKTYSAERIVYCPIHDAAPELLEALKAVVSSGYLEGAVCGLQDQVDAAIAKATGGQQ